MSLSAVSMRPVDSILSAQGRTILGSRPFNSNRLATFEQLGQFSGFVLYETLLPKFTRDPSNLVVTNLRDRGLVYVDDEFAGALSRENYINTLSISASYGSKLSILVENQGRINFQIADDYKVLLRIFYKFYNFKLCKISFAGNFGNSQSSNFPCDRRNLCDIIELDNHRLFLR